MNGEGVCDTDDRSQDLKSSKEGLGEGQKELDEFGKDLVQRSHLSSCEHPVSEQVSSGRHLTGPYLSSMSENN